jgi:hypothetical protein
VTCSLKRCHNEFFLDRMHLPQRIHPSITHKRIHVLTIWNKLSKRLICKHKQEIIIFKDKLISGFSHDRIASSTHQSLLDQFTTMRNVQTIFGRTASKLPEIQRIFRSINIRRAKDTWILVGIIGLCGFFMIWYLLL